MTAVQYDGAGFPDLVLARRGTVLFRELKREVRSDLDEGQSRWFEAIDPDQNDIAVWRPSDWPKVQQWLR